MSLSTLFAKRSGWEQAGAGYGRTGTAAGWLQAESPDPAALAAIASVRLSGLSANSRDLAPGWAFAACAGERFHGLAFIDEVLERKPSVVLWEPSEGFDPATALERCRERRVPVLAVASLRKRLGRLAARIWGDPSRSGLRVYGVTGTDGKTSVSQFLAQALDPLEGCGIIGTLGHGRVGQLEAQDHTTPDAPRVQQLLAGFLDSGLSSASMEVSSHALSQGRVDGVRFHTAILTNLGRDHLDFHVDMEGYAAAKRLLFLMSGLRTAVLNAADPFADTVRQVLDPTVQVVDYALDSDLGDGARRSQPRVLGFDYQPRPRGTRLSIELPSGCLDADVDLLGRFNASNLLAVVATLVAIGWPVAAIRDALSRIRPIPGRMEPFYHPGGASLVVDYAHTPGALASALMALREHSEARVHCIFGCGGERDRGKRALMAAAAERHADTVILTDDNPRREDPLAIIDDIQSGFLRGPRMVHRDRREAMRVALAAASPGDMILVAGKGHEDVQIDAQGRHYYSDRQTALELTGEGCQ